jgi:hypothetical protein
MFMTDRIMPVTVSTKSPQSAQMTAAVFGFFDTMNALIRGALRAFVIIAVSEITVLF